MNKEQRIKDLAEVRKSNNPDAVLVAKINDLREQAFDLIKKLEDKTVEKTDTVLADIKATYTELENKINEELKKVSKDKDYSDDYFKKELQTLKNVIADVRAKKVDRIIEKTEVIKEVPNPIDTDKIATEASEIALGATKELIQKIPPLADDLPKYAGIYRDALETLKDEDRLSASAIKDLPEFVEKTHQTAAFGVREAPRDGKTYGRNNRSWTEIITTETDPLSLHLDQTTPQTITGLDDGILSLNSGELGTFHYENKWFVSSETGSDDNDGKSEGSAFELLRKGLEQCSSGDVVAVTDSATYTPDSVLSIPNGVTLYMPLASLSGEIQLGTSSRFIAKGHYPSDDGQTMVSCIGTSGSAYTVYGMNSNGYSDIIHFKTTSVGGYIVADVRHITVGASTSGHENILVYSTAGSTGVNIATTEANFSSDKTLNYGYASNLVYGTAGYTQWNLLTVGTPVTITYDNVDAVTVSSYKMKATSSGTRMPKNWTFYGQLAGDGWVLLDTRTSVTWIGYEEKEFTISSPDSYDEYKIVIASTTNGDWLQIDDFGLLAGVASVGGDVMIESDILTLGEYAQGIQSHDSNQRVVSNINNVYSTGSNDVFVDMSNGTVSHRGNIVTVETVWDKTGGVLTWNTSFDFGTKTGEADSYTLKNTDGRLIDLTAQTELTDEDATATDGTDATQDQLINNMRTRINELETKLVALGLLVDVD